MALKIDTTKPTTDGTWEIKDDDLGFSIRGHMCSPGQKARIATACTKRGKVDYEKMYDILLVRYTDEWDGIQDESGDDLGISPEAYRAMPTWIMEEALQEITGIANDDDIAEIDPDNPTKH